MTRTAVGFLVLLLVIPALPARDKPEEETPEQQYQRLIREYDTDQQEYQKALKEAKTPQDRREILQQKYPRPAKFAPRFLELAEKHPKNPEAVDALVWIVTHIVTLKSDPDSPRGKAITILLHHHVQSERMAATCQALGTSQDDESKQLARAVLEKNPHRAAKAQACLALAKQAENRFRLARRFKDQPDLARRYESLMGKEAVEALVKTPAENLSKEAAGYYERIVKEFADVAASTGGTLGEAVKDNLEVLRHPIVVGKPAPEMEGEDIEGKQFKLSDYRGKVVLLDFWGNW